MDIKLTQKNSVLKTAGTFATEDINLSIDDSLLGGGSSGDTREGYTLTLTTYNNSSYPFGDTSGRFLYRINDGEWQTFGASPITIENVKSVDFKAVDTGSTYGSLYIQDNSSSNTASYKYFRLEGTFSDYSSAYGINRSTAGLKLFADLTLYLSGKITGSGAGA